MEKGSWVLPAGAVTAHQVDGFPIMREGALPTVLVKCGKVFYSEYCKVVDPRTVGAGVCRRCEKFSVKQG